MGGTFYGTTILGGTNGHGTVFKYDNTGHETLLFGELRRRIPNQMVQDSAGNLYGTTGGSGSGNFRFGVVFAGTVFKLLVKSSH